MIGSKSPVQSTATTANPPEPWQQRVLTEKSELNDKIMKLAAFLVTEGFLKLDLAEQNRLERQQEAMIAYRSILTERIEAWSTPEIAVVPVPDTGTVSE